MNPDDVLNPLRGPTVICDRLGRIVLPWPDESFLAMMTSGDDYPKTALWMPVGYTGDHADVVAHAVLREQGVDWDSEIAFEVYDDE